MGAVGYLTFGFTTTVCGTPALRYRSGDVDTGSMIFQGYDYDLDSFQHPSAAGIEGGTNPLYDLFDAGGKDGSFLFQTVNKRCLGIITPASGSAIPVDGEKLGWYFPCNLFNQWGTSVVNMTGYSEGAMCHTQTDARTQFAALKPLGQVYFTWGDLKNSSRNLGVYDGCVRGRTSEGERGGNAREADSLFYFQTAPSSTSPSLIGSTVAKSRTRPSSTRSRTETTPTAAATSPR